MTVGQPKMGGSWWRDLTECGPLEKGMANHFSILALRTPWTVWKGKNDRILKEELPRSVGAQYATGDQWRNNSRKNEETEPKQKQHPVVDVTGDGSKVWCCKEKYCIGTWNVSSMNQGKLLLLSCFSLVRLCVTPWMAAYQAPPSMGFSRQGVLEWG